MIHHLSSQRPSLAASASPDERSTPSIDSEPYDRTNRQQCTLYHSVGCQPWPQHHWRRAQTTLHQVILVYFCSHLFLCSLFQLFEKKSLKSRFQKNYIHLHFCNWRINELVNYFGWKLSSCSQELQAKIITLTHILAGFSNTIPGLIFENEGLKYLNCMCQLK